MNKELSSLNKVESEAVQKRELMEEVLIAKLLREMPDKTPIKKDRVVFRVEDPYSFQDLIVIKIVGDKAEIIPYYEMEENNPISMLSFNVSELWDENDYAAVLEQIRRMSDQELAEKISQPKIGRVSCRERGEISV